MDDHPTLFTDLPVQRQALRHAERLLLLSLPDHPCAEMALVKPKDEPVCRRLLKRNLVVIALIRAEPDDKTHVAMMAARLPAALPLISA